MDNPTVTVYNRLQIILIYQVCGLELELSISDDIIIKKLDIYHINFYYNLINNYHEILFFIIKRMFKYLFFIINNSMMKLNS